MMRSMKKRKFTETHSIFHSESQKKIKKNDKNHLPTPEYIQIVNGLLEYHFASKEDAKEFCQTLAFLELDLNEKIETDGLCVKLSEKQFNRWLEKPDAYKVFTQIGRILDESSTEKFSLINDLLDEKLANQAALLNTSTIVKPLYSAIILADAKSFTNFYAKLSTETLNTIALRKDQDDANTLMLIVSFHSLQFGNILKRVRDEVCNKAVLCQDSRGDTLLSLIARECPYGFYTSNEPHVISQFLKRLTPKTLQSIILSSSDEDKVSLEQLSYLDDAFYQAMNALFEHPESFKNLTDQQSMLRTLGMYDRGNSIDVWSTIAKHILFATPPVIKHSSRVSLSNDLAEVKLPTKLPIISIPGVCKDQWKFLRLQGRTVLFENEDKNILAFKIQKRAESLSELVKEYKTTYFLNKNSERLGLKSQFPIPHKIAILKNFYQWVWKNDGIDINSKFKILSMIGRGKNKKHGVYIYEIETKKSNYFNYLHDPKLTTEKFNQANRIVVHDLFTLLQHGVIFSQLADIFHNLEHVGDRKDKGRYIVLVNLLRNFYRKGSGRLTNWMGSVAFPNVRESGIADLGDRVSMSDLIGRSERVEELYGEAYDMYRSKTCNYLIANIMAEYQYVLFLIAGRRGFSLTQKAKEDNKSKEEIELIWLKLATQMVTNCVDATYIVTKKPKETIEKIFLSAVDVNRLARQMQYWMTDEYIEDLKNNRIREDIYEKDTEIEIAIEKFRKGTFSDVYGCSIDGINRDLGPVNGQEPIKEENKLLYWMINYIFTVYNQFRLTLKDLHHIVSAENLGKAGEKQSKSFGYLPAKNYHAIQEELYKEYLKQKEISGDDFLKNLYEKSLEYHKKSKAAFVIGDFWRKHKKQNVSMKINEEKNTLVLK